MRIAVRRVAARRQLRTNAATWPINPAAGRPPDGWPGWPEGKKFAVVLTHDVESMAGLNKSRQLMEIDRKLGFRSSFNFVPAGPYRVSPELRQEITANRFEVGVHDLNHDGKLFQSREGFDRKAQKINEFLVKWGATGFRSAFMLRNLEWMQGLDMAYDSSTFDTDPFEIQPDGANTIFPFWVPSSAQSANKRGGYVELPYTLAQDSTVYLVLQEKSPEIWLRKLDWIVAHGGMALVNVHPDYIQFEGQKATPSTYPEAYYRAFLEHIRGRYSGQYWQPVAKEMAEFVGRFNPRLRLIPSPKRVAMITHSFYENDNRVTRYAEAFAGRGDHVDVVALRSSERVPTEEVINGVNIFRIQNRLTKTERSKWAYLWPVVRFLFSSSWWITRSHAKKKYDLLHIHNMPDFLIFAGWYPKLLGVPLILDIHDIVPEFYGSKFGSGKNQGAMGILRWLERRSAKFANHVIISNDLWLEKYQARTLTRGKCSVFINNVDTNTFRPQQRMRTDGKIIVLFPGGLQWHQGLDIAIRAFQVLSAKLPLAELHIYGDGIMKPSLLSLTAELGLTEKVLFFEPVRINAIAQVMANADLGIVPKRADTFGNEAYSTKIMEFMSLGVPVVVSKTKIDQFYFDDSVVCFFESGNSEALAGAMFNVLSDRELRRRLVGNALEYAQKNSWSSRKIDYLQITDRLIGNASSL